MFGQKSLDNILSGFNKVIRQLEELLEHHDQNVTVKNAEIESLKSEVGDHLSELAKTHKVLSNIKTICGHEDVAQGA